MDGWMDKFNWLYDDVVTIGNDLIMITIVMKLIITTIHGMLSKCVFY